MASSITQGVAKRYPTVHSARVMLPSVPESVLSDCFVFGKEIRASWIECVTLNTHEDDSIAASHPYWLSTFWMTVGPAVLLADERKSSPDSRDGLPAPAETAHAQHEDTHCAKKKDEHHRDLRQTQGPMPCPARQIT